ncbi:MAG: helix-turn-helix domain-containing protein [Candidatus Neomarinimicrobiota bacterium]
MSLTDRKEREKQLRIEAILAAAKELYSRKGYQETTMADIAEASELGKATIYYYFPNKEAIYRELFLTCVRAQFRRLEENIVAVSGLEQLLQRMLNAYVDWAYEDPAFFGLHYPMGKNAPVQVIHEPEVIAEIRRLHEPVQHRMNEIFSATGSGYDSRVIAGMVWTYMSGLAGKIHQGVVKAALEEELNLFVRSLTNLLNKDN